MENDQEEIDNYYNSGDEEFRLQKSEGQIEFERTKEIISRYLPEDKLIIYDIGGGTGNYALWLAGLGHEVHLSDTSESLISKARAKDSENPQISSIEIGDARTVVGANDSADLVLLFGPLYHLTAKSDRIKALKEIKRILKPGGRFFISGISRYGSLMKALAGYGSKYNTIEDVDFVKMVETEIRTGQHIRPSNFPLFFPRSYFHLPQEMEDEIFESDLQLEKILPVEGPLWIIPSIQQIWNVPKNKENLLDLCRLVENEKGLISMSLHFIAIGKK